MVALYNEIDPHAAAWLRDLINGGHIAPGVVDERSIEDLEPDYVRSFTQFHGFAGIGGWSLALRLAGWPDNRPVWTLSCPCQPFSAAGKGVGFVDERHLWPSAHHLIRECEPDVVFGEQVASKDGLAWLDLVFSDLQGTGYAFGPVDLCAAGVGSPQIRQRLFLGALRLADGNHAEWRTKTSGRYDGARTNAGRTEGPGYLEECGRDGGLADGDGDGCEAWDGLRSIQAEHDPKHGGSLVRLGDGLGSRLEGHAGNGDDAGRWSFPLGPIAKAGLPDDLGDGGRRGPTNGYWGDADWLFCRDAKWRPVEPGSCAMVDGLSPAVVKVLLKGFGNAISPEAGKVYIEAFCEAVGIPLTLDDVGYTVLDCHL